MATLQQHHDQILENLQLLEKIGDDYPNEFKWKSTIAFYAAVHMIEGFLETKGQHTYSHHTRKALIGPNSIVQATKLPVPVYLAYEKLQSWSEKARYYCEFNFQEKHFIECLNHLSTVCDFYNTACASHKITCPNISCVDKIFIGTAGNFKISHHPQFIE